MRRHRIILLLGLTMVLAGLVGFFILKSLSTATEQEVISRSLDHPPEQPVVVIPLEGPIAESKAEVSGLAWHGNYLILLPQYPRRLSQLADGALFGLHKDDILAHLNGTINSPLKPMEIPITTGGFERNIPGFEGFEAIDILDKQVFLTIEARKGLSMMGYVIKGNIASDLRAITLDPSTLTENPPQTNNSNKSDESLLIVDNAIITLYEVNGWEINPNPHATMFNFDLRLKETVSLPQIEYRVTDASALDEQERFWVINYYYPGDKDLEPGRDSLSERYGEGATHAQAKTVERLLELKLTPDGIVLTDRPPIQLQLLGDKNSRNWEGLVRLGNLGFLLITDKHPETILGFVSIP